MRGRIPGIVLVAVVFLHVAYYGPRVVDDMFISLRYASSFAHGAGAVFNPGERVEGYSSPAWMVFQALGLFLHAEPVLFTKALGVAALLALAFGVRELCRSFGVSTWHAWLPSFAIATSSYVVSWSVLGLETPLHLALIVLAPLAVERAMASRTRSSLVVAAAVLVLMGLTRPEALAYVGINLGAPLLWRAPRGRVIALVAATTSPLALFFLARHAYYGDWLANTYYVKGASAGFDLIKLRALVGEGTPPSEAAFHLGGIVLLAGAAVRTRRIAPFASAAFALYFTASVAVDWMPNLRHLLPALVLAPVGWAWGIARVDTLVPGRWQRPAAFVALALFAVTCAQLVTVDHRLSPIEHHRSWVTRKSGAKLADVLLAYRRVEPPHIAAMGTYEMGQISQCWPILETSAEEISSSWYAGRDIGAVGFYTGVRVFDVAGLVTREVSRSRAWTHENRVEAALVDAMFAHRPVSADIFDGWDTGAAARPDLLEHYRIAVGSPKHPHRIVATDRTAPTHDEVLARYRAMAAKLPQAFHVQTLYGETAGAAVERRLRIVAAE